MRSSRNGRQGMVMNSKKLSHDDWWGFQGRYLLARNIQLQHVTEAWPWQQSRVLNPLSLPLAALWLPRARRKRDKDFDLVQASEVMIDRSSFAACILSLMIDLFSQRRIQLR